jgi:low temperature requirement protein LtrA
VLVLGYIITTATMALHAAPNGILLHYFFLSVLIQKVILLVMLLICAQHVPIARPTLKVYIANVLVSTVCYTVAFFVTPALLDPYGGFVASLGVLALLSWIVANLTELLREFLLVVIIPKTQRLYINIDHMNERCSSLVFVVLGEAILATTLQNDEVDRDSRTSESILCMVFMFTSIFFFSLLYFHAEPPRELHAFIRTRMMGVIYLLVITVLCCSLLILGVATRYAMMSISSPRKVRFENIHVWLLMGSMSTALLSLNCVRYLHFSAEGCKVYKPWWYVMVVSPLFPVLVALYIVYGTLLRSEELALVTAGFGAGIFCSLAVYETILFHLKGMLVDFEPPSVSIDRGLSSSPLSDLQSPLVDGEDGDGLFEEEGDGREEGEEGELMATTREDVVMMTSCSINPAASPPRGATQAA